MNDSCKYHIKCRTKRQDNDVTKAIVDHILIIIFHSKLRNYFISIESCMNEKNYTRLLESKYETAICQRMQFVYN